ncbi:DUF4386 domain-containing protein [Gordonia rhizosphera]|uniref:DUF4386 domain-containing protein n=1 Tax=Gordonia rhizosphera NBRC 16068 TaxID=1108045 RepID=K6WYX7_9ACTN|nr:DUF4386 domain-containing protein [Gordonia rhizosphera]GAB91759.1 hypothetical protein GORHZ_145_00140 [Gordonia rhizosphera NBRC 16068]
MTTSLTPTTWVSMSPDRKATLAAGLFYLGTFVFSIPALALYDGVVNDPDFVLGAGSDRGVPWGGLIEILTALTCIGTAVALYPVLKRYGPGRAIGFVASRTLEAAMICTGVVAVLTVYTMRQELAGTDATALTTTARALVAVKDWTFLLGPGIMPAVNALCFATIVYQFRLVPRWIPTLGLIGAPLLLIFSTGALFGVWDQVSGVGMLAALPIATWEFSVGIYMTVKGFRMPPVGHEAGVGPVASVAGSSTGR